MGLWSGHPPCGRFRPPTGAGREVMGSVGLWSGHPPCGRFRLPTGPGREVMGSVGLWSGHLPCGCFRPPTGAGREPRAAQAPRQEHAADQLPGSGFNLACATHKN